MMLSAKRKGFPYRKCQQNYTSLRERRGIQRQVLAGEREQPPPLSLMSLQPASATLSYLCWWQMKSNIFSNDVQNHVGWILPGTVQLLWLVICPFLHQKENCGHHGDEWAALQPLQNSLKNSLLVKSNKNHRTMEDVELMLTLKDLIPNPCHE